MLLEDVDGEHTVLLCIKYLIAQDIQLLEQLIDPTVLLQRQTRLFPSDHAFERLSESFQVVKILNDDVQEAVIVADVI